MNPMGAGDVKDVSLLRAGYHIGINTVGQSLRNANLQLRSEPANPQLQDWTLEYKYDWSRF